MKLKHVEQKLKAKRILVTGHTGFTGSWVRIWLESIGAQFYGLSLDNSDDISLSKLLESRINSEFIGDIADSNFVFKVFEKVKPEYVLHLAAQPIVSVGYMDPFRTITSNTQGMAVILEACRITSSVETIVCVTTDKVYKNLELGKAFIETDELKGGDPYSLSKSASEHVIEAYHEVFNHSNRKINLHVARGGNIVGGGDYAVDRIIPDLVRSIIYRQPILIRQPNSNRPWQHVLSLIHGYFLLLAKENLSDQGIYECWNFGPSGKKDFSVSEIIDLFTSKWESPQVVFLEKSFKESKKLNIDSTKALNELNWKAEWNFHDVFSNTIDWYKSVHTQEAAAREISELQLSLYRSLHSK